MPLRRALVALPVIAMLLATGCSMRDPMAKPGSTEGGDQPAANSSQLSSQVNALAEENDRLTKERDKARADLAALRGSPNGSGNVNGELKDLLAGGDIAGLYRTKRGGIAMNEDFAFAKGSANLNPAGASTIKKLAERLNRSEFATGEIVVEGHTDSTPVKRAQTIAKYRDNWGLSAARAATVVRALQDAGVAPTRLHGAFRGEYDPLTGADASKNRRVDIYIH